MNKYELYLLDTETTGLCSYKNDVIELSILRYSDGAQKTWHLQPTSFEHVDAGALRVNGHKLEDLKHQTAEGKELYKPAKDVIVDVENWILEDNLPNENRVMVAHNVVFDKNMLEQLWSKCESRDTFPFGRRTIDTSSLEFFMDLAGGGEMAPGYSLANLNKKYKIVNSKAHTAEADTKALYEVFKKQLDVFSKLLNKNENTICSQ